MKELSEEQKTLISQKQNEYHIFSNLVNLLENEIAELSIKNSEKLAEYEEAKEQFISAERVYSSNQLVFNNCKIEYVNKQEVKNIFSILFKSFVFFTAINIVAYLCGFIDVVAFKDVLNYFLCTPLFAGSLSLLGTSFFSNKIRERLIKKFYELDESKEMLKKLDKDIKNVEEKRRIFEDKKKDYKECSSHMEQLEFKVKCNKNEMENIKTSIFEIIYDNDKEEFNSDISLSLKM